MVSSTLVDAIASPYDALYNLFQEVISQGKLPEFPSIVSRHFANVFENNVNQIPLLDTNAAGHSPGSLIHFRAMVQDTSCSPEVYMSCFGDKTPGGWGFENRPSYDDQNLPIDHSILRERDIIWAISIPGEARWCKPLEDGDTKPLDPRLCNHSRYPFPDTKHIALQLKIYDGTAESLRPTSIHSFIGILSFDPTCHELQSDILVPTLHVLFHRQLPKFVVSEPLPNSLVSHASTTRDALITWLSDEALGRDRNAAEWVLLSCLSSVESREPPLLPMSIVLSHFPRPSNTQKVPTLNHLLQEILPLFHFLPLSLSFLNEHNFQPESINEDLRSAILQVPQNSTFLVSETGIEEGNLTRKGIENTRAIQEIAKYQNLRYKFPFNEYSFPTDITLITLTEGKESLLMKSQIHVQMNCLSSELYNAKVSITWPSEEILSKFRDYILRARSNQRPVVGASLSTHIKNDFVLERQKNPNFQPDDLIHMMTVAKNIARSKFERELTTDTWLSAKKLYTQRKTFIH